MKKFRCINCGYEGEELIFQFNDYTYCVASNMEEPEYLGIAPEWTRDKGDAKIGEPVGCPKCYAWDVNNFEPV